MLVVLQKSHIWKPGRQLPVRTPERPVYKKMSKDATANLATIIKCFQAAQTDGLAASQIDGSICLSVCDAWGIGDLNFNPTGTHQKDTNPPCLLALGKN